MLNCNIILPNAAFYLGNWNSIPFFIFKIFTFKHLRIARQNAAMSMSSWIIIPKDYGVSPLG